MWCQKPVHPASRVPDLVPIHRYMALHWIHFLGMSSKQPRQAASLRVGQAAEMLGISIETLRRWDTEGRISMERSAAGQRRVAIAEVSRLLDQRRRSTPDRPIVAQSARNRFPGVVTRVEVDGVAAVVEVLAGPHRLVSLVTAEAVHELGLKLGDEVVCIVKSTSVMLDIPLARETRA